MGLIYFLKMQKLKKKSKIFLTNSFLLYEFRKSVQVKHRNVQVKEVFFRFSQTGKNKMQKSVQIRECATYRGFTIPGFSYFVRYLQHPSNFLFQVLINRKLPNLDKGCRLVRSGVKRSSSLR